MNNSKIQKLVGTAVLAAIIIVLQLLGGGIHIGPVSISLVLVPIVIGALIYGPGVGAILGAVFGVIVIIMILAGMDPASMVMLQFNPAGTIITCLVKGILAGLVPGLIFKAFKKHKNTGVVVSSVFAPVMNTGFYVLMVVFVFKGLMEQSYNVKGTGAVFVLIITMIATNFLWELISTVVITPIIYAAVKKVESVRHNS